MKIAVYTSIFGKYDILHENQFQMEGVDYLCFTDEDLQSNTWNIIKSTPLYNDPNRNAKKYKILPHRYLKDYDYSVWIDGNILIVSDIRDLAKKNKYQVFDHNKTILDPRDCIYQEYNAIIQLGQQSGNYKDNPQVMHKQVSKYLEEGYPQNNGLATNPILLREHHNPNIIKTMEDWWIEIKYGSRRDQLSFNYVAWKNNFKFNYLEGDSRKNKYFLQTGKHKKRK